MKILMTGATGFIGQHLLKKLVNEQVVLVGRTAEGTDFETFYYADLANEIDLTAALTGIDVVIHCAGITPDYQDQNKSYDFMKINCGGTLQLAEQAATCGVKRFIFLSTAKVNGEFSAANSPFKTSDRISPAEPYSFSKAEAETGLIKIANETNMEFVIIRPPLVYGFGMKGYLPLINKLASMFFPFPIKNVDNKRSFVSVNNLIHLIDVCVTHPNAVNKIFFVSDGQDISISDLIKLLMSNRIFLPILIPVPVKVLNLIATLLGKERVMNKLCSDFQLDISDTEQTLSWKPIVKAEDELRELF